MLCIYLSEYTHPRAPPVTFGIDVDLIRERIRFLCGDGWYMVLLAVHRRYDLHHNLKQHGFHSLPHLQSF
jgi:hypothetical protein